MTLWGGGFRQDPSDQLWDYTVERADRRLLAYDVAGSLAHISMLGAVGVLDSAELDALRAGLETIAGEAKEGSFLFLETDEDVHSAVERRLGELAGEVAGKLHTGRSRNDQVALDMQLYLREASQRSRASLRTLIAAMIDQAEAVGETIVASYTHLQQAQAVPLAHHLLAYVAMLRRDHERFADLADRLDWSPLGAGASAGSSLPLDPSLTAQALGFARAFENSLDAVAARDLSTEFVFAASQAMVTVSRLAEEIVLWATAEFGWLTLSDAYATGSSAMPQKKNPDIAELARGRTGRMFGYLQTLLVAQKGLPLAYNRDLQEDKAAVFGADDLLAGSLQALAGMISTTQFHPPGPDASVTALDLAERLVERGVPFRVAHQQVGELLRALDDAGRSLGDATSEDLVAAGWESADLAAIAPVDSVRSRSFAGAAGFGSVKEQLADSRRFLKEHS